MRRSTTKWTVLAALVVLTVGFGVTKSQAEGPDREAMRAKMMERIDTNRDGIISSEERAKAKAEFAKRFPNHGKAWKPNFKMEPGLFVIDKDFQLFDMKAIVDPSTLKLEVKKDWTNIEGDTPARTKTVSFRVNTVLDGVDARAEVQFIVPRDRKAKGFLITNNGLGGDNFKEHESTLLRNGIGLVKTALTGEGPGGMVSVYIARLDPTHSNEYCLWPATIMRAITAAYAEKDHFEKGKIVTYGGSKHGASSHIAIIHDDRITAAFTKVCPISHSPVRLHDNKIWHERERIRYGGFVGGLYGINNTKKFVDFGHKWEDIETYCKKIAPSLFLSLNKEKLQKRGVELLSDPGTHDGVAYTVHSMGKYAPWVPVVFRPNGGHRGDGNPPYNPNLNVAVLRHFLGADQPRLLPRRLSMRKGAIRLR